MRHCANFHSYLLGPSSIQRAFRSDCLLIFCPILTINNLMDQNFPLWWLWSKIRNLTSFTCLQLAKSIPLRLSFDCKLVLASLAQLKRALVSICFPLTFQSMPGRGNHRHSCQKMTADGKNSPTFISLTWRFLSLNSPSRKDMFKCLKIINSGG